MSENSQSVGVFSGSALSDKAEVPPLTAILLTMQERFTVPLALEIGVASVMRWKHTGLMVRCRPTIGVVTTDQTSQVALRSGPSPPTEVEESPLRYRLLS
jgi:hypothetical protein